jgi:DNA-directed RNA polymerase subunit M/transcription elongation factor TFIIS
MAIPAFRQEALQILQTMRLGACHARMMECAAFQSSGSCRDMYALYLEEFVTYWEANPTLPIATILHRAVQPLVPPKQPDAPVPSAGAPGRKARKPRKNKLVCPRCRSKDESVLPFEKQKRSADEPANQYAQCLNPDCRKVWRIG